ncbi:hypothetical protein SAMN05443572_12012 [Myxococcus fulvus]|uniref:Uncharacterized protein n=1 Tax=Myxococcus fulvus TaxID=33 RepID=A0A511TII1_MYXFU|nr:hypothetical protein [Myxococcus fulvus]GEN13403.1 hypothetical protein MFU01_84400 [Myxococcus fulvus]SEU42619.1 hypothetical protein SAMN05443572_12012 [Myxococcus fulvus]
MTPDPLAPPVPAPTSDFRRGLPAVALVATLWMASSGCASRQEVPTSPAPAVTRVEAGRTHWVLRPSEAYDALCLLNLLRGDVFYTRFYPEEFQRFSALLEPGEKAALAHLTERMGKQAGKMVGPYLTLVFSVTGATTVEGLARTVSDDAAWAAMRRGFQATSYSEDSDFTEMEDVRQDLGVLFAFLQRIGFSRIWRAEYLPQVEQAIARLGVQVAPHDVVGWDEDVLGRALHVEELNAHVLKFAKPHGIRVTGWNFLTDLTYPLSVTVKTAVHELLHPPFKREGAIDARLTALEADPYFQRLVREHDPAFGYTTAKGLTEEDCAEAIDVFVSERQGLLRAKDGKPLTGAAFFRDHDDGMHVLAYVLYEELRRADFSQWTTYEDFLLKLFDTGVLVPGKLEQRFRSYTGSYPVKALKE